MADENTKASKPEVPKRLGRYMVREELGSGTHGYVYKGYDPYVGRMVAIKVGKLSEGGGSDASTIQAHQNLFKEARTTGFLQHPNIVSLYDVGVEDNIYYIVMEYIEGNTIAYFCGQKVVALSGNPQKVIRIFYDCCLALDYSHNNSVLHRDIKPSNVMLTKDGKAKIMDFSIAYRVKKDNQPNQVIGSPTYMSPEQIMGKSLAAATDQFSLAVVMYYLLAKKPPLYHSNLKELFRLILKTDPEPLSKSRPELPIELSDIIAKAMQKDPKNRFSSCKEFGNQLMSVFRSAEKASLNPDQKNDAISRLSFFKDFNQEEIETFINSSEMKHANNGDLILKEGDKGVEFYVIISGEVDIIKNGMRVTTLKSGDVFGEMVFLTKRSGEKRTASVKSRGDSLSLKINPNTMDNFSQESQLNFYKVFCENLVYRLWITTSHLTTPKKRS